MADMLDKAQASETITRTAAIAAALKAPAGVGNGPGWENGRPVCLGCGDEIPAARIQAMPGTSLCVHCAADAQEGRRHVSGR